MNQVASRAASLDMRALPPRHPDAMAPVSPTVAKTLRYVEWTFLLVLILRLLSLLLNTSMGYELATGDYIMLAAMGGVAVLSFVFPSDRPRWQRQTYIGCEIFLLLMTRAFSTWGLNLFLYLVLVKSCFLLSRRAVIFTTVITDVAWQISYARQLFSQEIRTRFEALLAAPQHLMVLDMVFNSTALYLASSLLVILLCWTVLAERKSRQQADMLSAEVEKLAADLERTRIARDIHDSLGHTLTSLDMQLEVAQTLHTQDPDHALQAVNYAKGLSQQSLQEVRRAVSTMRHGTFDLSVALTELVEQIQQTRPSRAKSFQISSHIDLPVLPLQTSQQLFLVVKEGLTNIQKHSQASMVELSTTTTTNDITIRLSDNGVGFLQQAPKQGFGLRGMQERIQLLHGQMTVRSTVGQGTVIQVTIPQ
ncbi:MAG: sensor histidine kinase [Cyanobacteria bacterium P01_D01_bin.2]